MVSGFFRLATVGVLMFGGGVLAASAVPRPVTSPGLPLTGTHCPLGTNCGPAKYSPRVVPDPKKVFPPSCPLIAHFPPITQGSEPRIEEANFTSVKASSLLSDASSSTGTAKLDGFIDLANRNEVVSTKAAGGHTVIVFVLYKCSTSGLAQQYVRVPVDPNGLITLETIRVARPPH